LAYDEHGMRVRRVVSERVSECYEPVQRLLIKRGVDFLGDRHSDLHLGAEWQDRTVKDYIPEKLFRLEPGSAVCLQDLIKDVLDQSRPVDYPRQGFVCQFRFHQFLFESD
jgi:hypothetical protein